MNAPEQFRLRGRGMNYAKPIYSVQEINAAGKLLVSIFLDENAPPLPTPEQVNQAFDGACVGCRTQSRTTR